MLTKTTKNTSGGVKRDVDPVLEAGPARRTTDTTPVKQKFGTSRLLNVEQKQAPNTAKPVTTSSRRSVAKPPARKKKL